MSSEFEDLVEFAAVLIWRRFAPYHHMEWEEETHRAEYRIAARLILQLRETTPQPADNAEAARYRWLRAYRNGDGLGVCERAYPHDNDYFSEDELDILIDAALRGRSTD